MRTFKRYILGGVGLVMAAAGLSLVPSDADAFQCRRSFIPWNYDPTGVECSLVCESELYRNNYGNTVCVIYGPKLLRP